MYMFFHIFIFSIFKKTRFCISMCSRFSIRAPCVKRGVLNLFNCSGKNTSFSGSSSPLGNSFIHEENVTNWDRLRSIQEGNWSIRLTKFLKSDQKIESQQTSHLILFISACCLCHYACHSRLHFRANTLSY